jgi:hypothetical protein
MNSLLKTHKTLSLVIIGLFNVIAYSQEKPIKHLYSQSIKVDQSADKVWNSITDVSQWNKWDKEVVDAKFNGLIDKKGVGNLIIPNGSVVDFEVVDFVEKESYTFYYKFSQLTQEKMYIQRILDIRSDGIYLTEKIWFENTSDKNI